MPLIYRADEAQAHALFRLVCAPRVLGWRNPGEALPRVHPEPRRGATALDQLRSNQS